MPKPLRSDFSSASVGLTLPAQHKNLAELHDWLVDEVGIDAAERVVALTNYQQGRFGRLPTHILLVTSARVAFTHDGGLRSVPLGDLDTDRLGLRAGLINGEITLVTRDGEQLTFRKGMSIAMQEVALALEIHGHAAAQDDRAAGAGTPATAPTDAIPHSPPQDSDAGWHGFGDDVIAFDQPVDGLHLFRIRGGSAMEHFAVWALSSSLQPQDLLVNASEAYAGVRVAGQGGPVAGLQINAEGAWCIEPLDPGALPVLNDSRSGHGDAAVFLRDGLATSETAMVLQIEASAPMANIVVWAFGASAELLVNSTDSYAGRVIVPAGTQFLAITCAGRWSLQP